MFKRILEMKEPLQSAMAILNPESVRKLTQEDWYVIEKCTEALACFEEVTIEISSEKNVTLLKVALHSNGLSSHCLRLKETGESVLTLVTKLADEVSRQLKRRHENLPLVWEATFLDPRFKYHGFLKTISDSNKQRKT